MNEFVKRMILERRKGDDHRRSRDYRESGGMDYRGGDYARGRDYGRGEYGGEFHGEYDGARGVKYTGHYGIGGDRRSEDYRSYDYRGGRDSRDYAFDHEDYDGRDEEKLRLTEEDMRKWKRELQNADGTKGEHFDGQQINQIAERLGIRFEDYDEKALCLTTNMLYSDYCEALKTVIPHDKELLTYVKLAQAWLEDEDASVKGEEKLAVYYYAIADKGDEQDFRRGRRR